MSATRGFVAGLGAVAVAGVLALRAHAAGPIIQYFR